MLLSLQKKPYTKKYQALTWYLLLFCYLYFSKNDNRSEVPFVGIVVSGIHISSFLRGRIIMKKKQKWLVGLLSTAIAMSPGASVFAADSGSSQSTLPSAALSDISGHWAQSSVEKWVANGVLGGYPNGMFYPNQNISRAEFVTILNRVFAFYAKSDEAFSDVSASSWYADQLSLARQAGIYQGFPGNKAEADTNITREDAITMLARLFELQAGSSVSGKFNDSSKVQAYAKDAVNALSGVLNGYQDGTLRPTSSITRRSGYSDQ
jgi:mannan endo-1,4-beta-mannosidase